MFRVPFRRPASHMRATMLCIAAAVTSGSLAACALGPPSRPAPERGAEAADGTFYGAPVPMGDGSARTYLIMKQGVPTEIGVALGEQALIDLPPVPPGHGHADYAEFILPLPRDNPTPYRLVELDWNPRGHEPAAVYGAPHFDVHFYTISLEERNAIDPADPGWARKGDNLPEAEYLPVGWMNTGALLGADPAATAIPRMGLHWIDPASPELHGQPFTATFLYGTWDGALVFAEPMVTRAFLLTRPALRRPIAAARREAIHGYLPSSYRVYWEPGDHEYRIALSGLTRR